VNEQLGPESRALLDAARDGLGPDEVAIRRMRARVSALAAGGAVGIAAQTHAVAATTATTTATTSFALGGIAAKLAVVAIAVGAAAGTRAIVHSRRTAPSRAPIVELPASAPSRSLDRDELAPVVVDHVREPAPPPPPARHVERAEPLPIQTPVPTPAPPSLARETELVDAALAAMSHGHPADALVAIERYTAETAGRGQLAEDAAMIEIEARCRLRDPRAAEVLAAFEARWPQSAERARLVAACE